MELILLVAVLAGAGIVAYILVSRRTSGHTQTVVPTPQEDATRKARQAEVETRGEELLERRVSLDAKRGTLGGDGMLYDALDDLQRRRQDGQISEEEFEHEKVRLLSGQERL